MTEDRSSPPRSRDLPTPPACAFDGVRRAGLFTWPLLPPPWSIRFEVFGPPKPSPRARHGKARMRRDPSADDWQRSIRDAAGEELQAISEAGNPDPETTVLAGDAVFGGDPVQVVYELRVERPKSHYRGNDPLKPLKDKAPKWPGQRPDIDNYEKAIYDALGDWRHEGPVLWLDDGQVVAVNQVERYALDGEAPGLRIAVGLPGFEPPVDPGTAFA